MARHIDAEILEEGKFPEVTCEFQHGWNAALEGAMLAVPTADVAPQSEIERAKAEALTRFAERLKNYYKHLQGKSATPMVAYHIDQVLKEFLEGEINGNQTDR